MGCSRRLERGHFLFDLCRQVLGRSGEDESDRFGREVAAADEPLISLKDVRMSSGHVLVAGTSAGLRAAAAEISFGARRRHVVGCSCPGFSDRLWASGGQTNGGA